MATLAKSVDTCVDGGCGLGFGQQDRGAVALAEPALNQVRQDLAPAGANRAEDQVD